MGAVQALILGVVQGVTEFLPISSDGHLAVTYKLMGLKPDLTFEIFLHLATLIAIVAYFRKDVLRLLQSLLPAGKGSAERRIVLLIVVGTFVSGVLALALEPVVEPMSESMLWVGVWFLGTAALLTAAELVAHLRPGPARKDASELGIARTAAVGVAQGLAALPGLSRSGSTISGGMMAGLGREEAARFSFLLGIPIIALAAAKSGLDVLDASAKLPGLVPSLIGFVAALVAGYAAIAALLGYVRKHSLVPFAVYTALVGSAVILWQFMS